MISLQRRMIVGALVIVGSSVGLAAAVVAVGDRWLTYATIDTSLESHSQRMRHRAVIGLLVRERYHKRDKERDRQETRNSEGRVPEIDNQRARLGPQVATLAWGSISDIGDELASDSLETELITALRGKTWQDAAVDTHSFGGASFRIASRRIDNADSFPEGRWQRLAQSDEAAAVFPVQVLSIRPVDEELGALAQRHLLLIATVLSAVTLAGLASWLFSRLLLKPLRILGDRIAQTEAGTEPQAISIPGQSRELAPIVSHLNDLLERVAAAVARERRVNADIAHELRTPLAAIRSQLEFALTAGQEGLDAEEVEDAARSALGVTIHMHDLVDQLLTLVRIEAGQISVERQATDLADLVDDCWAVCADAAQQRGQHFVNGLPQDWNIQTDSRKLRIVLTNLLNNAVAHGIDNGSIRVEKSEHSISISNDCPEGSTIDPRMFEPFWRGDRSRSNTGLHCGLGLSIAKRLCEVAGGELSAHVQDNRFTARIQLPPSGS